MLWVWLRLAWPAWRDHLHIVEPATVLRWHRKGWRLYWTWKSRTRLGRPRLSAEVRDLIATMSRDNPLWGSERIRGELLKLGIVVSKRSIRRYRWRKPSPRSSQTWRTFLANELRGIWAADLLVVQTVGYRVVYVFFFISHDRRELVHLNVTSNPTVAWIWQQLVEATPWGHRPDYLIHDRDAVYGRDFGARLSRLGITSVRTPFRAPRANAIAERLVRSIRRECSASSRGTTTSTVRIGASISKAPYLDPWYAMDRSPGDPCWEAFTTYMGVLIELGIDFCPPSASRGPCPRDILLYGRPSSNMGL